MRVNWKIARLVAVCGAFAAVIVLALVVSNAPQEGADATVSRRMVLTTTLKWARLAPIPTAAEAVTAKSEGSMFTREFIVEFTAPADEVKRWLAESPGTKDLRPVSREGDSFRYVIKPQANARHAEVAQYAEVVVSQKGTRVRIRTYWS